MEWIDVKQQQPDNLNYQQVAWELPSSDGNSTVKGVLSGMYEIYKNKEWYSENGTLINGVTHWKPFDEPPKQ